MNKESLLYRVASRLYKVLICILAPICFLFVALLFGALLFYRGMGIIYHFGEIIQHSEPEELIFFEFIFIFTSTIIGLICAFISKSFVRIVWSKLSPKKTFLLFWLYYFVIVFLFLNDQFKYL